MKEEGEGVHREESQSCEPADLPHDKVGEGRTGEQHLFARTVKCSSSVEDVLVLNPAEDNNRILRP